MRAAVALTLCMLLAVCANAQDVELNFSDLAATGNESLTTGANYVGDFTSTAGMGDDTIKFVPSGDFITTGATGGQALRKVDVPNATHCSYATQSLHFDPNNQQLEINLTSTAAKKIEIYATAINTNAYMFYAMGDGTDFFNAGNINTQSSAWVTSGNGMPLLEGIGFNSNKYIAYAIKNAKNAASPIMVSVEIISGSTFVNDPSSGNYIRISSASSAAATCLKYTITGFDIPQDGKFVLRSPARGNLLYQKIVVSTDAATGMVPATDLAIGNLPARAEVGGTYHLSATALPNNTTYPTVAWSIVSGTATVSKAGSVSGLTAPGLVKVRAAVVGTEIADTVEVEVFPVPAASVAINIPVGDHIVGQSYGLTATVLPANTTHKGVTWSISDAGTTGAQITAGGGLLSVTAAGTLRVKVQVDSTPSVVADSAITFVVQNVESIEISGNPTATVGTWYAQTWQAAVLPATATNRALAWSSSNEAVATVDANGLVKAIGTGTAAITVTAADGGGATASKDIVVDASLAGAKQEAVVIYENFGGVGTSEPGMQPTAWPSIYTDEGYGDNAIDNEINARGGWRSRAENINGIAEAMYGAAMPQPSSATYYNAAKMLAAKPALQAEWDANGVVKNADGTLTKNNVPLRNGYTVGGATTVGFKLVNMGAFPFWYNGICYDTVYTPGGRYAITPVTAKNTTTPGAAGWDKSYELPANNNSIHCSRPDEKGYLFFGSGSDISDPDNPKRATFSIPAVDGAFLANVTKLNVVFSATRTNSPNMLIVMVDYLNAAGTAVESADTLTYTNNAYGVREVTVPVKNGDNNKVRLHFYAANLSQHVSDYEVNGAAGGVANATLGLTNNAIYAATNFNRPMVLQAAGNNSGINISSFKVYAMVDAGGYTVTANKATASKPSGIAYGEEVTVTPTDEANFVGWRISGRPDLSEVVSPLVIKVTENLEVTPLYAGDKAVVPVVNENFINWKPEYEGRLDAPNDDAYGYINYANNNAAAMVSKDVKVPLRFGAATDSASVALKYVNVVPDRTIRVGNAPNAEKWMGFIGLTGAANTDKGYVELTNLPADVKKAVMEFSTYETLPLNNIRGGGVAVFVNDVPKRNFADQYPFMAKTAELDLSAEAAVSKLTIGYANQTPHEYPWVSAANNTPDPTGTRVKTGLSTNYSGMHSLKVYAEATLAATTYKQLTMSVEGEGAAFAYPDPNNSTNMYPTDMEVTLLAKPAMGYGFDGWRNAEDSTLLSVDAVYSFAMDADKKVIAVFAQNPSYIIVQNELPEQGSVSYSEPQMGKIEVEDGYDTLVYLAGVGGVKLTATPGYGWALHSEGAWEVKHAIVDTTGGVHTPKDTVINIGTISGGDISFTGAQMEKGRVLKLIPKFEGVMERDTLYWITDKLKGDLKFNEEYYYPDYLTEEYYGDTTLSEIPTGSTVTITPEGIPTYYRFNAWVRDSLFRPDTLKNVADEDSIVFVHDGFAYDAPDADGKLKMDALKRIKAGWISINTRLSAIELSAGELVPAFDPEVYAYTVTVPNEVASIIIAATPDHEVASVTGDGEFALTAGGNGRNVVIAVTAEDAAVTRGTYSIRVRRETPTSVVTEDMKQLNVYPNPVSKELTVEGDEVKEGQPVEIYNMSGALVARYNAAGTATNLNVSQLANGTYLIKIGNGVAKFVKQ